MFSHEWFRIHLQWDKVELEMNSEPRVDECEKTSLQNVFVIELCSLAAS